MGKSTEWKPLTSAWKACCFSYCEVCDSHGLLLCLSVAVQGKNSSARVGLVTPACGRTGATAAGTVLKWVVSLGAACVTSGKVEGKVGRENSSLFSLLLFQLFCFVLCSPFLQSFCGFRGVLQLYLRFDSEEPTVSYI